MISRLEHVYDSLAQPCLRQEQQRDISMAVTIL